MGFVKDIAKGLFTGVLGSLLFKKPKAPKQARPVTRDELRDDVAAGDELRRRKGAAADLITGTRGAEAAGSSVGRLVVGS